MHKIPWDFEIKMDHPILARRLDLVLIDKNKIICQLVAFAIPIDQRVKIKVKK